MADIRTSDVQTYVRELIAKEFGACPKAEKVPSEIRKKIRANSAMADLVPYTIKHSAKNRWKPGGNRDDR